ncbi:MAG: alpha-galactosidase [Armatimonadetes bacterium]|nr:alpha-galactosidase [Armatimonadota bacterium]
MRAITLAAGVLLTMRAGQAEGVLPDELLVRRRWCAAAFQARSEARPDPEALALGEAQRPPFSFVLGGRPSAELLPAWGVERSRQRLDADRTARTITYTDPVSGLEVRCVGVEYEAFPVVEWTLHLRNTGAEDTPLIEELRPLDLRLQRGPDPEFVLHTTRGGVATPGDYEPLAIRLDPNASHRLAPRAGRSCDPVLPYFSLEAPVGRGVNLAIGWPGQWVAEFTRDADRGLRVAAGQEGTRFVLHPHEAVRTPLIAVQFWRGERVHAQNVWRRWMLAHNVPRPDGRLPEPMFCGTSGWVTGWGGQTEANQNELIEAYFARGVPLDYWWIDAGWYDIGDGGWESTVGTWEPDRERFPNGLKAVADHARARGAGLIVWFEPERVCPGSALAEEHPEWLLAAPDREDKLLNLGDPDAREWLTQHVGRMIDEQGIDVYRQDFNLDPLTYWRAQDAEDRQGLAEIRYLEGHLAHWDELRRRFPALLIDSCASGGRRNDLETLRRAVPLQRSDYTPGDPVSQQGQTYGIASWMPFFGDGALGATAHDFRCEMAPSMFACYDPRSDDPGLAALPSLVREWRQVAAYYLGDYYPLTPYSLAPNSVLAWQFDRPDLGAGMIQAFRRAGDSAVEAVRLRPGGLAADAEYDYGPLDGSAPVRATGRSLMRRGLTVTFADVPEAALIVYRRAG